MSEGGSQLSLGEEEVNIVIEFEEEQFRLSNFEKIFPCINNWQYYGQFFEYSRPANELLWRYLRCLAPKYNQHHLAPETPG